MPSSAPAKTTASVLLWWPCLSDERPCSANLVGGYGHGQPGGRHLAAAAAAMRSVRSILPAADKRASLLAVGQIQRRVRGRRRHGNFASVGRAHDRQIRKSRSPVQASGGGPPRHGLRGSTLFHFVSARQLPLATLWKAETGSGFK
ncbi:uncharacterized protein PSANT_02583 [Moesziomyces antarcticus]|uniref:Uncharacterized protein n=1 Tax=Pseudozyma antarctica TaxID=84753 RepID=A0A5C3FN56_PSEA2|nr:uncharacterized protein PSANT_02583 [Moesziomyces antarcticus]